MVALATMSIPMLAQRVVMTSWTANLLPLVGVDMKSEPMIALSAISEPIPTKMMARILAAMLMIVTSYSDSSTIEGE